MMRINDILTDNQYKVVKLQRGVLRTGEAFRSWAIKQKLRMAIRQPWLESEYDEFVDPYKGFTVKAYTNIPILVNHWEYTPPLEED